MISLTSESFLLFHCLKYAAFKRLSLVRSPSTDFLHICIFCISKFWYFNIDIDDTGKIQLVKHGEKAFEHFNFGIVSILLELKFVSISVGTKIIL